MPSRSLPVVIIGACLALTLCFGSPAAAGSVASADAVSSPPGPGTPAPDPVSTVTRKMERLGARLGIEVPPGAPESARARYLSHRLGRLLEARGPGLSTEGLPVDLIRYLTLVLGRLDRNVWEAPGAALGESEREVLGVLSGVLDAIHGKLDRLEAQPTSGRGPRLRAMAAPANDACGSAIMVGNESVSVTTVDATNDASASCGASTTSPDVWYRYVAPSTGLVKFSTSGSDYDPVLTLFDACPGSGGVELACDDDSNGRTEAMIVESVTAGQEILVRVSGFSGAVGDLTLTIELTGGISGTVTKEISGEAIGDVPVDVWSNPQNPFPVGIVATDASGDYLLGGLDGGTYYANVYGGPFHQFPPPAYVGEIYQEISCALGCSISEGTPISVTLGAVTSGIDFTLEPLGAISGQVTASDPMSQDPVGEVYAWRSDGQFASGIFMEADGTYRIEGLAPGTYFVTTNTYTHLDELFDDIQCHNALCDPTTGTPVIVDPGATTTGIDFQLEDLSTITGAVTRTLDGAALSCGVRAVSTDGTVDVNGSFGSPGVYSIQSLPPRNYHVVTECPGYFDEVWDDVHCLPGCNLTAGAPVTVPVASTVSGIDFVLDELGALGGTVYSKVTGAPISDFVDVFLLAQDGTELDRSGTDGFGAFSLTGIYPGNYRLEAVSYGTGLGPHPYQGELFDNVPCAGGCSLAEGVLLPVVVNGATTGLDFYLSECSSVSYKAIGGSLTFQTEDEACEVLTVGPNLTIAQDGSAVFRAGKRVALGSGFTLESGATLRIEIDPNLSTEDQ